MLYFALLLHTINRMYVCVCVCVMCKSLVHILFNKQFQVAFYYNTALNEQIRVIFTAKDNHEFFRFSHAKMYSHTFGTILKV